MQTLDSLTRRHADSGLFHIGDMQIDDTIGTENSSDMQVTENSRDMQVTENSRDMQVTQNSRDMQFDTFTQGDMQIFDRFTQQVPYGRFHTTDY